MTIDKLENAPAIGLLFFVGGGLLVTIVMQAITAQINQVMGY